MLAATSKKEKQERYIKYLKERYIKYLRVEGERCSSAKRLGLKECQRCGYCCIFLTCVPKPDEIEPIAKFLGLTTKELVRRYMLIDRFINTHYFLRWAKEGQQGITGKFLSEERVLDKGYCILYDKETKSCRIHPVRPLEARDVNCWEESSDDGYRTGASCWSRYDICKFVPDFKPQGNLRILRINKVADIKAK